MQQKEEGSEGSAFYAFQLSSQCFLSAGLTEVARLVQHRVPEADFLESIGQEITFVLPYSGARDGSFARLFQDLDLAEADLGLTGYGISDTTLEEVAPTSRRTRSAFFPSGSPSVRNNRKKFKVSGVC